MNNTFVIRNYKCFKEDVEFEEPSLINLIIGRNNSGKSSLLDVFGCLYGSNDGLKDVGPIIVKRKTISEDYKYGMPRFNYIYEQIDAPVKHAFDGAIFFYTHHMKHAPMIGQDQKLVNDINAIKTRFGNFYSLNYDWNLLLKHYFDEQHFNKYEIVKVDAERDIKPEIESADISVKGDGTNFTSVIFKHYINKDGNKELLKSITKSLNRILYGEDYFDELKILRSNSYISIALASGENEILLNDMGSGLKTILLVLYALHNLKQGEKKVFMFEELENNLHPEIQRRLFNEIYKFAVEHKCRVFITTHSHVAINCFYGKENAKIYHIFKNNGSSYVQTIDSDMTKAEILNDLGVKASDLFQTNGVIWVEGPSDRIYIKKWLELEDHSLKENTHYTFLYYAGRLLSHYSAQSTNDVINILLQNRNSAIVMDSDKKSRNAKIGETKKRITDEFNKKQLFCWTTKGKEIENYLDVEAIKLGLDIQNLSQIGQYELFPDYIKNVYKNFSNEKVVFAQKIAPNLKTLNILDLKTKIKELANTIRKWNNID